MQMEHSIAGAQASLRSGTTDRCPFLIDSVDREDLVEY